MTDGSATSRFFRVRSTSRSRSPPISRSGRDITEVLSLLRYSNFREAQRETVEAVLAGSDALLVLRTGGGKSMTFQLPALVRRLADPRAVTVVVTPLISLMQDQAANLNAKVSLHKGRPVRRGSHPDETPAACFLGGGESNDAGVVAGRFAIVYVTPEKLDAQSGDWVLQKIQRNVTLIAVDEAHAVSSYSEDFRPSYKKLASVRADRLPGVPMLAVTATASPETCREIKHGLGLLDDCHVSIGRADRANLSYSVIRKTGYREDLTKMTTLVRRASEMGGRSIIYTISRGETEKIHKDIGGLLSGEQPTLLFYHGAMSPEDKRRAYESFREDAKCVVIATNAFGMGIDTPNIRLVVHYGLCKTLDAYVQETGRAGRDDARSDCVMFWWDADVMTLSRLHGDREPTEVELARTRDVVGYAESKTCCRRLLCAHFGVDVFVQLPCRLSDGAIGCDRCAESAKPKITVLADAHRVVKPLLSAVRDVYGGEVKQCKAAKDSTGAGRVEDWRKLHRMLADRHMIQRMITAAGYPVFVITAEGRAALSDSEHSPIYMENLPPSLSRLGTS